MLRLQDMLHGTIILKKSIRLEKYALHLRTKNFGVQRMEMLAIYFALADNWSDIIKRAKKCKKSMSS